MPWTVQLQPQSTFAVFAIKKIVMLRAVADFVVGKMRYNFNFCCMEERQPNGAWWHPTARFFALYGGAQFAPWDTDLRRDFEKPA